MNKEKICKNCKYHYIEPITFDYPQSICKNEKDGKKGIVYTTEEWLHCNNFEYSQAYIRKLQQENKQYESDIKKLMYDIENLERLEKQHQEINGKLREELNIYENIINLFNNGKIYFNEMMEKFKELEESGK